ncbi:MAG: hypothetical protein P794_07665 [Epsilonproteobacteria bacterium (ex Lamellibrachia satsuma)]|nr:MAG: hypothetical protein P794_07665 [Epsilonproteobacteria bacterium (ex Lamellibrachia satsuma)]
MDKMHKIILILAVILVALWGVNFSFAKSGGTGTPQMEPMLPTPDGGHPTGDDTPHPVPIVPIICKNPMGFSDCYRSKTRYCDSNHLQDPNVCRSQAYTQCDNANCK